SDMIIGLEQQYSEPLSKGGINAFVFGPNEDNTLLIQQLHEKIDFHTEAITELQNATKELMIHSQDMKRENELSHEQQRDQGNRVMNLLYEKQTSFFVKKCDLIVQKLTERDLTLDELAITFKQKKQGLLRYLNQLEEKGVIKSVKVFSGERGRPKNKYHLIGENSEKK
ncbi:MAG: hypothetical protein KAQ77_13915, partial [Candidatus Heimdallarchaeota archaeon]|nr:hypothetical protein [Candidatus Heimdallarchaeota archaeon]